MGKTFKSGYLQNLIAYDASGNITLPGTLTINGNTLVATQSYVSTQLASLVASAPTTLDTLNELASALGNDPNFATTIATTIGGKVPQTRTITINGTTLDLSADRSFTIAGGVTSFNTRTGAITPASGDYTTAQVTESGNLYYTDARGRAAISLTTTGTSGAATYNSTTGIINIPQYQGGVTSFNTRTGAITLTSTDVTTALGYTPSTDSLVVKLAGTQTITGIKTFSGISATIFQNNIRFDPTGAIGNSLSLKTVAGGFYHEGSGYMSLYSQGSRSLGIYDGTGAVSLNLYTSALTVTRAIYFPDADGTIALTSNLSSYVPTSRTLTINGTTYDLTANRSWTITPSSSARTEEVFTATANQTTFTITGGYVVGLVDVYVNGIKLLPTDYTASNGSTVILGTGVLVNDTVTVINYTSTIAALPTSRDVIDYTATSAQTSFTVSGGYIVGLLDVYVNGIKLTSSEFTATNGTTFILTIASVTGDQVQAIRYNASVNGVAGSGTATYVPKFTASGTIGNSAIIDNGTTVTLVGRALSGTTAGFTGQISTSNGSDADILINVTSAGAATKYASIQSSVSNLNLVLNPTNGGKVGVGTTSPSALFEINKSSNSGSGSAFPRINVVNSLSTQGDGSSTYNFADIRLSAGNGAVDMYLTTTYASGTWAPAGIINVATNHNLQFKTNNTERMRISEAGNFDYGGYNVSAASPSVTYKQSFWGALSIMWRGAEDSYINSNHTYQVGGPNMATYTSSNGIGRLGIYGGNFEWGSYNGTVSAGNTYGLTSTFIINKAGNVGIGTISPSDYSGFTTLHINGKSGANGGVLRLTAYDSTSSGNIYAGASALNINTTAAVPIKFLTRDTLRMQILDNGAVNIGWDIGNQYSMTSGGGSGTAIVDTGITYNTGDYGGYNRGATYQVVFNGNPNAGGSGAYFAQYTGIIMIYTGWSGSAVTTYINYTQLATGNNISTLTLTPVFWNGSTESSSIGVYTTGAQIRLKISGYNSSYTGQDQSVYLKRLS
jgi:hypothetical protein